MSEMSLVNPEARKPDSAITRNRITWMVDWKNANVRPRVSSSTSRPTIVFPVAYAMPGQRPEQDHEQRDQGQVGHQAR